MVNSTDFGAEYEVYGNTAKSPIKKSMGARGCRTQFDGVHLGTENSWTPVYMSQAEAAEQAQAGES